MNLYKFSVIFVSKRGSILIEILIVVVIITILASLAIPSYHGHVEKTRLETCIASQEAVNKIISMYHNADGNRSLNSLAQLVEDKYLERTPNCPYNGTYILLPANDHRDLPRVICSHHYKSKPDGAHSETDIPVDFDDLSKFILVGNTWQLLDNGIYADGWNNRLYTQNPMGNEDYTITVNAQLGDEAQPNSGYGIFFDAIVNSDGYTSSAYILQFDRGFSEIIIREWQNNREGTVPLLRIGSDIRDIIPHKNEDPDWWSEEKNIRIKVSNIEDGKKQLKVYLDGVMLFDNFVFASKQAETTYAGFRTWGAGTHFKSLRIGN